MAQKRDKHGHPGGKTITIKDVARELGLSITTISRALNGYSDVGEATRERVQEKARELGYRPNRNAQRLVTRRTRNLAWIQSADENKTADPHFVEVLAGVLRSARDAGYDIIMRGEPEEHQVDAYDSYVRDNSVDGFIVDLVQPNDARINYLLDQKRPFMVHGRNPRSAEYSWVDVDNEGNFYRLTRLLVANGHKRIAFINGDEKYSFAEERHNGVRRALTDLDMPESSVDIHSSRHPMGLSGADLTQRALKKKDVTAIIYSSALMASEAHSALKDAGRRPGDNICVASMDDMLNYVDLAPFEDRVTFVRSSLREAGAILTKNLIHLCEHPGSLSQIVMPSTFVLGRDLSADGVDASLFNDKEAKLVA